MESKPEPGSTETGKFGRVYEEGIQEDGKQERRLSLCAAVDFVGQGLG